MAVVDEWPSEMNETSGLSLSKEIRLALGGSRAQERNRRLYIQKVGTVVGLIFVTRIELY